MFVKLAPDLFSVAYRTGEGALLRVWLLARAKADPRHPERIERGELVNAIVTYLHVAPRYAKQLLEAGDNLWWRLDKKSERVYIIGTKAVFTRLGGRATNVPVALLPIAKLSKLSLFYATCYAAHMQRYVRKDIAQPVSRAALMKLFGVTRNTLRSWEKAVGVKVLSNFAFAPPDLFRSLPDIPFEYHCNCGHVAVGNDDLLKHQETCDEKYVLVWHRPNSYLPKAQSTTGTASPIGRVRINHYRQWQAKKPAETKRPLASSSGLSKSSTAARRPLSCFGPGRITVYRPSRISDPLPMLLVLQGVDLQRIWRAYGGEIN